MTSNGHLLALGHALRDHATAGVGVVRVLSRHGFGTVESGQLVLSTAGGEVAGGLFRGALDGDAVPLATAAAGGAVHTQEVHVSESVALQAGLACAGGATLLGHPLPAAAALALGTALADGVPAALVTPVDGTAVLVLAGPDLESVTGSLGSALDGSALDGSALDGSALDGTAAELARGLLRRGATATVCTDDLLLDLWVPQPAVLVVGSGAIGDALAAQAALLGWTSRAVAEVAETVAAVEAFTDADALVLLDHDPAFDAALIAGLPRGRGFIGALGSRHTQAARRERLRAAGLTDDELARLRGPVGLDLGARTPAETAVSIVAQVIAVRGGRDAAALASSAGRIGG